MSAKRKGGKITDFIKAKKPKFEDEAIKSKIEAKEAPIEKKSELDLWTFCGDNSWDDLLTNEMKKPYFVKLRKFVESEYASETIFPPKDELFSTFDVPLDKIKVIVLGQDPYHGPSQAHGLSFSVKPGVKWPPSLRNIFKELQEDLGIEPPSKDYGYLKQWADQGVLLLNDVLTVRKGKAHSHKKKGWEDFTTNVLKYLNRNCSDLVWVLWGKPAQKKGNFIDQTKHTVFESSHPSPLSARRSFFGSKIFSKINTTLKEKGKEEIDWEIKEE